MTDETAKPLPPFSPRVLDPLIVGAIVEIVIEREQIPRLALHAAVRKLTLETHDDEHFNRAFEFAWAVLGRAGWIACAKMDEDGFPSMDWGVIASLDPDIEKTVSVMNDNLLEVYESVSSSLMDVD